MFKKIEPKWLIAIAFVLGLFMEILDMTVLNTALPAIGREFEVGQSSLQYALTGYLISLAVFIPASGWVADRFGSRNTFAFAIGVFTIASALAGVASSMEMLVAARVLQGVGGGMLTPVGTAMLFRAFPPAERAKASAVLALPVMVAPALGPVLGGWLTDQFSWRWIFYLNLPIGLIAFLFTLSFVPNHKSEEETTLDWRGFLLAGFGLATLLVGLERTPSHGWGDTTALVLMAAGTVSLAVFVWLQLRIKEPMLDLRLLKDRNFAAGNVMLIISTGALMGILFLAPLLLQQVMGLSATDSGLVTLAQVIGMMITMPIASSLYSRLGSRLMMSIGFVIVAAGIFGFATLSMDASLWWYRGLLFVVGVGMSLTSVPSQAATMETITFEDTAAASSLISTMRQFASAAGVAVISTILVGRINAETNLIDLATATEQSFLDATFEGYHATFIISGCLAIAGAFLVVMFRKDSGKNLSNEFVRKEQAQPEVVQEIDPEAAPASAD